MRKAIFLSALLCAACSNYPASLPSIKPYKMDIQQGNVVTPKMMMQLRPGMTKAQVKFVMGTPLISDSFHANRWDYFYQMRKDGRIVEQRRVILDFEDEKLTRVRGDVVPAGSNSSAAPSDSPANKAPVTLKSTSDPAPKEKGLIDKLKFWKSDEAEPAPQTGAKPAPVPAEPAQPAVEEKPEVLPPLMEPEVTKPANIAPPSEAKPEPKPEAKAEQKPESKVAPEQKAEERGLLDKLKFWKSDEPKDVAKPEATPAPKADPAQESLKAEHKPAPKPESKPEPTAEVKPAPKVEPKPAPKPKDELPAEDDPSYFEKMLEKIGF